MKKFFKEFKDFATRGNVVDLAVGVIIGAAFQKIVTSAVNDLVMPLIGLLTGTANFNDAFVILSQPEVLPEGVVAADVVSLELAKEYGFTTLNYGAFISTVLDFIIMAFVIFLMIKLINKATSLKKKEENVVTEEAPAAPTTKVCPYCLSEIPVAASKCAHCTSDVPVE